MSHGTDSPPQAGCAASRRESPITPPDFPWAPPRPGMGSGPLATDAAHLQARATRLRAEAAQLRATAQHAHDEWRQILDHLTQLKARIHQVEAALAETETCLQAADNPAPGWRAVE